MISTLCRGGGFFINDIVGAHEGWNQGRMKVSTAPIIRGGASTGAEGALDFGNHNV